MASLQYLSWILLGLQGAIVLASLLGYGLFTSRPDLLAYFDPPSRFFTWAFSLLCPRHHGLWRLAVCIAPSVERGRGLVAPSRVTVQHGLKVQAPGC